VFKTGALNHSATLPKRCVSSTQEGVGQEHATNKSAVGDILGTFLRREAVRGSPSCGEPRCATRGAARLDAMRHLMTIARSVWSGVGWLAPVSKSQRGSAFEWKAMAALASDPRRGGVAF